jgi:hypothetical protein
MKIPFSACVGTDIEDLIYANQITDAAKFFRQSITALSKQSKIILYIPQGILDYAAHNDHIKAIKQQLSFMTQSKVSIGRSVGTPCAWKTSAPEGYQTTAYMQGQVHKRELPFTIGLNNINIEKSSCESCLSGRPCKEAMTFYAKQLNNVFVNDLESATSTFVKEIAEHAITVFYKDFILDKANRILLARLLFIKEELDCALLPKYYDHVHTSIAFYEDVNKAPTEDKQNIILSAARAFCYPPVKDTAKREKGSLDWHTDIQPLKNEVDFFRADVLPGLQTGKQNSGAKRLFFGRRCSDKQLILFGYTPDHDFSPQKLINRWKSAESEL